MAQRNGKQPFILTVLTSTVHEALRGVRLSHSAKKETRAREDEQMFASVCRRHCRHRPPRPARASVCSPVMAARCQEMFLKFFCFFLNSDADKSAVAGTEPTGLPTSLTSFSGSVKVQDILKAKGLPGAGAITKSRIPGRGSKMSDVIEMGKLGKGGLKRLPARKLNVPQVFYDESSNLYFGLLLSHGTLSCISMYEK